MNNTNNEQEVMIGEGVSFDAVPMETVLLFRHTTESSEILPDSPVFDI